MRAALALGSLILLCAAPAPAPAQSETRYFTSVDGLMDGNADVVLKEVRSGRAVTSAVLDVCYPAAPGSHLNERFVVNLTASGQTLSGTAQTLKGKEPVAVKLTRKAVDGRYDFSGQITVGRTTVPVESTDNSDVSEDEFNEMRGSDGGIVGAPQGFTEVSPEAIGVRIAIDAAPAFLAALKGQDVEVDEASLLTSCDEWRSGEQVLTMTVDPERSAEFLARFKDMPGVIASGWTGGRFDLERTLRFAGADWRESGGIDRARVAALLSDTLKQALKAQSVTATWDRALGRLAVTAKRPSPILPGLGLTETLRTTAIVAPDRPVNADHLLLWLDYFTSVTTDETDGNKLRIAGASGSEEEGGAAIDDRGSIAALAAAFKAQLWDIEREAWK